MDNILPQPAGQAGWWNPDAGQDTDVVAHTPDPTKYHYPDGRQGDRMRSGVKGVVIPRSTRHGGSQGFDATRPGVVHVDPEAPDGGAIVDLQTITAAQVTRETKTTRHPHEAFYALAGKQVQHTQPNGVLPESPRSTSSPIQPVREEREFSQVVLPSLSADSAASKPMEASMQPAQMPHIPSLQSSPQPTTSTFEATYQQAPPPQPMPQPAPQQHQAPQQDPGAVGEMFRLLMARMDQMESNGHQKAAGEHLTAPDGFQVPLPPVQEAQRPMEPVSQPQRPSEPPQPPQTRQPAAGSNPDPWGLDMPWIVGPKAERPRFQVIFNMAFGAMAAHYHEVIQNGHNLVLVYDTRFDVGQQFMPANNAEAIFEVEVPAMKEKFRCSFGGQAFSIGSQDVLVFIVHAPAPSMIAPPSPMDTRGMQQSAAFDQFPHAGVAQAMGQFHGGQ